MIEHSRNSAWSGAAEMRGLPSPRHVATPMSPAADKESLGARLRRLRVTRRLSQADLAAALDVSVPAVSGWEKDRSRPRHDRVEALSHVLGVSTAELLGTDTGRLPTDMLAENRAQIAHVVGTTPDKVRIIIEF